MPWDFWKYDRNNTTLKVAVRKRQLANPLVLPPEPPPDQPPAYQQPQPEDYSIAGIPQDNPLLGVQVTRQGGPPGAPKFNPLSPAPAVPFNAGQTAREAGGAILTAADALGGWWNLNETQPSAGMLWNAIKGRGLALPSPELTAQYNKEVPYYARAPIEMIADPANLLPGIGMTGALEKPALEAATGIARAATKGVKAAARGAAEAIPPRALGAMEFAKSESGGIKLPKGGGVPEDLAKVKALSPEHQLIILNYWKDKLADAEEAGAGMAAELEQAKNELRNNPADQYVQYIQRMGETKGELDYLRPDQVRKITGRDPTPGTIDSQGRVPFEYALDYKASELYPPEVALAAGYPSSVDMMRAEILKAKQARQRVIDLQQLITSADAKAKALKGQIDAVTGKGATPATTAFPTPEPGMPEAGVQPGMFGGQQVVRPHGKGKVTQVSMEDQLKLEQARQAAERKPTGTVLLREEPSPLGHGTIWNAYEENGTPLNLSSDSWLSLQSRVSSVRGKSNFRIVAPKPAGEIPTGTVPTGQAKAPQGSLPRELAGAKSRYNIGARSWIPQFQSDVDKALYTVAQTTPNKNHNAYMAWLRGQLPGKTDAEIQRMGKQVRAYIKSIVRGQPEGPVDVPSSAFGYAPAQVNPQSSDLVNKAVAKFGTTDTSHAAIFILPDGRMLDGSHGMGTVSSESHSIIKEIYPNSDQLPSPPKGDGFGWPLQFQRDTNAVRIYNPRPKGGYSPGGNFSIIEGQPITDGQRATLRDMAHGQTIYYDVVKVDGGTSTSGEIKNATPQDIEDVLRKIAPPPEPVRATTPLQDEAAIPPTEVRSPSASTATPSSSGGAIPSVHGMTPSTLPPSPTIGGGQSKVPPSAPQMVDETFTERRFKLPEPPRDTNAFMPFARNQAKGSFRGKQGAFDTVEQAHQVVLKARDMGEQTVEVADSYVRKIGDPMKEFGIDPQGMVTKVGNPQNRSLAYNDVLSNYTHYDLTPKQQEIAKRLGDVYAEGKRLAESYGVNISTLGGPDEFWQYIARRVKGKLDPITGKYVFPQTGTGGFRMGAQISAQKERAFDQMLEGVNLGYLYENPQETMGQYIKGIYRLIGNKQAENLVKPLTKVIPGTGVPFGFSRVGQPALIDKMVATDIARAIDKVFTPEQELKALRVAADVSGAAVGQVAALDISAPFIQGLPVLAHDIKRSLTGHPSAIWAKSYGNMVKALVKPGNINEFRAANPDLYKRAIEYGIQVGQSEFTAGTSLVQKGLSRVPLVGGALQEGYRQTWGRAGQAYSDFLEIARIKMLQQMEPVWQRTGEDMFQLGAVMNRMTGTTSAAARGVGANRRLLERSVAFAPNYLRSSLLMMRDMVSRGATAAEVRDSLAVAAAVGAGIYYAGSKAAGQDPKMNPLPKRYGGDGTDAFTFRVGDTRVGLGSWMYGMIKTLAEVGAIAADNPQALLQWNEAHPVARFAKSKAGPILGLAGELATQRDFMGNPFTSGKDYLDSILGHIGAPISAQSMLIQKPKGELPQVAADLMGGRTYPVNPLDKLAQAKGAPDYNSLEPAQKSAVLFSPEGQKVVENMPEGKTKAGLQEKQKRHNDALLRDEELKTNTDSQGGIYTATDWREDYTGAAIDANARSDIQELRGEFKKKNRSTMTDNEKAMEDYFQTFDTFTIKDASGKPIIPIKYKDGLDLALEILTGTFTAKQRGYVENNVHPNATPLRQEYYKDMETMKSYFDMVSKYYNDPKQRVIEEVARTRIEANKLRAAEDYAGANQKELMARQREYGEGLKSREAQFVLDKKQMLYNNPEIDKLLVKWGYNQNFVSPRNKYGAPAPQPVGAR